MLALFHNLHTQIRHQLNHRPHIAYAGHIAQDERLIGQQAGRQQGHGRILVAAGHHCPLQGVAPLNDQLFQRHG